MADAGGGRDRAAGREVRRGLAGLGAPQDPRDDGGPTGTSRRCRRAGGRCAAGTCSSPSTIRGSAARWRGPAGPRSPSTRSARIRSGSRIFSGYETTAGGIWRLAGVTDYFSSCEHGWHISPTCTGTGAIEAVKIAIAGAGRPGGAPLARLLPARPGTGGPVRIKLATGNGGAFRGTAFAKFIASRPELAHIRTRARSPGQNGVRERASGSLKYEHPYRHADQIATLADLHREAEHYRMIFNQIRPHESLGMRRPIEIITDPSLHPVHNNQKKESVPEA